MGLTEDIRQKNFSSEYHKGLINIIYTGNWLQHIHIKMLKPYGLSPQQYNILRILRGQHPAPVTVCLLQERMLDKMSNASRLVDKLKQKKLVERKECKSDRRQVDVLVSDNGLNLLKELDKVMNTGIYSQKSITETEAETLNNILDKLRTEY